MKPFMSTPYLPQVWKHHKPVIILIFKQEDKTTNNLLN